MISERLFYSDTCGKVSLEEIVFIQFHRRVCKIMSYIITIKSITVWFIDLLSADKLFVCATKQGECSGNINAYYNKLTRCINYFNL